MSQAEMFPPTEEERIATLRSNLADTAEKRKAKLDTAIAAHGDAKALYDESLGLLEVFDRMVAERDVQRAAGIPLAVDVDTGEVLP